MTTRATHNVVSIVSSINDNAAPIRRATLLSLVVDGGGIGVIVCREPG